MHASTNRFSPASDFTAFRFGYVRSSFLVFLSVLFQRCRASCSRAERGAANAVRDGTKIHRCTYLASENRKKKVVQARVRAFANLRPRKHEEFRLRSLAGSPLLRVPPVSCLPSSLESRGILALRERAASVLLEDVVDRRRSFNALRSLNVCLLYSFLFHSDSVETLSLSFSLFVSHGKWWRLPFQAPSILASVSAFLRSSGQSAIVLSSSRRGGR